MEQFKVGDRVIFKCPVYTDLNVSYVNCLDEYDGRLGTVNDVDLCECIVTFDGGGMYSVFSSDLVLDCSSS